VSHHHWLQLTFFKYWDILHTWVLLGTESLSSNTSFVVAMCKVYSSHIGWDNSSWIHLLISLVQVSFHALKEYTAKPFQPFSWHWLQGSFGSISRTNFTFRISLFLLFIHFLLRSNHCPGYWYIRCFLKQHSMVCVCVCVCVCQKKKKERERERERKLPRRLEYPWLPWFRQELMLYYFFLFFLSRM
jgi:hypothetical protein